MASVIVSPMFVPSVMSAIIVPVIMVFSRMAVTSPVGMVTLKWRSFVNSYNSGRSISIVTIAARQMTGIDPAASFRIHINSATYVIIDPRLRKIIIIVIA
jgi:hypothetical protein